ncbi:MAG TPA: cation:proton antiporter [Candidatus Hydrogenedentes bacterium]|nr:cation:proton antiporter [Candidatus Hydrogenedentota bacterium]
MNILSVTVNLVIMMLGAALVISCIRLFRGPTLPDRVVALDLIATLVVGLIAAYAIATNQSVFLIDAIVLTVISFLGTVAFAYYVGKGGLP